MTTTLPAVLMCVAASTGAVAGACLATWFRRDFTAYLIEQIDAWRQEVEGD